MVSITGTAPDEEQGPQAHNTPPVDVEAELDRARPEQSKKSVFEYEGHDDHEHSPAGVSAKVMFVRTIGEVAGMGLSWFAAMKVMNGAFEKSTMRMKDRVSEKYILPRIGKIEAFVQKYVPGIASKKLVDARELGDASKVARTYAPYLTDIPVALVASFGGKVWAQEELNKRLDVPLKTHENWTSAFVDNGVQFGSVMYLASPVGRGHKEAFSRLTEKLIKPYVRQEKLADYADYGASFQVPNIIAFASSSAYLLRQALDEPDRTDTPAK